MTEPVNPRQLLTDAELVLVNQQPHQAAPSDAPAVWDGAENADGTVSSAATERRTVLAKRLTEAMRDHLTAGLAQHGWKDKANKAEDVQPSRRGPGGEAGRRRVP